MISAVVLSVAMSATMVPPGRPVVNHAHPGHFAQPTIRIFERRAEDTDRKVAWQAYCRELDALWALTKRNVTRAGHGTLSVAGGSAFKLSYAGVRHKLGELTMRVLERAGLSYTDIGGQGYRHLTHSDLHAFKVSIAAGTSQIQRNILAERVLGLPKEH